MIKVYNSYKVYFNDSYLLICTNAEQMKDNFRVVLNTEDQIDSFIKNPDLLFTENTTGPLLIQYPKSGEVMCKLLEKTDIINAAGGLVRNEQGELLMIHRRGFWDLPKGKLELKETAAEGAKREVEEETGVLIDEVKEPAIVTYHAYVLRGMRCIKHTDWFHMIAKPNQHSLVPQTEEDIEDVRWVKKDELSTLLPLAYPLIADLVRENY